MTDSRHPTATPGQSTLTQPRLAAPGPHAVHPAGAPQVPHAPRPVVVQSQLSAARPGIAAMPVQAIAPTEADLDPIELVEDEIAADPISSPAPAGAAVAAPPAKSKIRQFSVEGARKEHQWKRTPHKDGTGACRVKTFHGKYSDQGMEHIDDVINEWLDGHPEVEVKFVTSTVHVFEGKIREPALVLNLWY